MDPESKKLRGLLETALANYHLQGWDDGDGGPYTLLDHLCLTGEDSVETGREQIECLADYLAEIAEEAQHGK